ncbi:MAG: hypothetical protein U5K69_28235 [Balneolaceae bacterium]|nr:hypothetical protein [Balneolaceae bacterium]
MALKGPSDSGKDAFAVGVRPPRFSRASAARRRLPVRRWPCRWLGGRGIRPGSAMRPKASEIASRVMPAFSGTARARRDDDAGRRPFRRFVPVKPRTFRKHLRTDVPSS